MVLLVEEWNFFGGDNILLNWGSKLVFSIIRIHCRCSSVTLIHNEVFTHFIFEMSLTQVYKSQACDFSWAYFSLGMEWSILCFPENEVPRSAYSTAVEVLSPELRMACTGLCPPSNVSCFHAGSCVPAFPRLCLAAGAPASPGIWIHRDLPDCFVR